MHVILIYYPGLCFPSIHPSISYQMSTPQFQKLGDDLRRDFPLKRPVFEQLYRTRTPQLIITFTHKSPELVLNPEGQTVSPVLPTPGSWWCSAGCPSGRRRPWSHTPYKDPRRRSAGRRGRARSSGWKWNTCGGPCPGRRPLESLRSRPPPRFVSPDGQRWRSARGPNQELAWCSFWLRGFCVKNMSPKTENTSKNSDRVVIPESRTYSNSARCLIRAGFASGFGVGYRREEVYPLTWAASSRWKGTAGFFHPELRLTGFTHPAL